MEAVEPEVPDRETVREAVIAASRGYFEARRARVDPFVDKWFTAAGSLKLHRHALGWDILRAPANIALAPVHVASRLGASLADAARAKRAGAWLRGRQLMLETDVMREVERLILAELLELPVEGAAGPDRDDKVAPHRDGNKVASHRDDDKVAPSRDDALARAILGDPQIEAMLVGAGLSADEVARNPALAATLAEYTGTRAAVAELTTALATLGAGAAAFHKLTPGALTLGPTLAAAMAQSAAISAFPLGATAGSLWYGMMPASASPALVAGTTAGLMASAAVFAAFAGVIADPVQRRLGVHRRRLIRLIDALERQFTEGEAAGFAAREHYVARLLDLMDAGVTAARSLRG